MKNDKRLKKIKYYSLDKIMKTPSQYYIIFGKRSNGKTYAIQEYCLKRYLQYGEQTALIRRWQDDFVGKRGDQMFNNMTKSDRNLVEKYSNGQWTGITYRASRWYLSKWDEELQHNVLDEKPFCFGFALNVSEHDKSAAFPNIGTIFFDEFLSRKGYITDEFIVLMNTISTIVRERDNVTIFMAGNTINKYCPYFGEMGLYNVKKQKQGTIDTYTYGDSGLNVTVEYCADSEKDEGKAKLPSDVYFAFQNPKLQMITTGAWEIGVYPHLTEKYSEDDVVGRYFIEFDREILECEIVHKDDLMFTYVHMKTTPLRHPNEDLIYSTKYDHRPNWSRRITMPRTDAEDRVYWFIRNSKIFYQSNEVGEIMRNYLEWCKEGDFD